MLGGPIGRLRLGTSFDLNVDLPQSTYPSRKGRLLTWQL